MDARQIENTEATRRRVRLPLLAKALILVPTTTLAPLAVLGTIGLQRALEASANSLN